METIRKSIVDMKLLKQRCFHKRETSTDDICVGGKINKEKHKMWEDSDHLNVER